MSDMTKFSFLDGFELPEITHEAIKKQLIKVGKSHKVASKDISKLPLDERLERIKKGVYDILGQYKGFVKVIYTEKELDAYINKGIEYCEIGVDTETNKSLDPLTCKLVGLCLYAPNCKPVYVPVNHCKPGTWERLQPQLTEEQLRPRIERLNKFGTKMIYHNGKFDLRVIKNTVGVYPNIYWDTMIGAQLLDENELAKLKYQYKAHINPTMASYNIEALFPGTPYEWVDPEVFALYAAIDPYDTYKLYQYQKSIFEQDGMERLYNVFLNIEMPVTPITAEMEDTGISVDLEFLSRVHKKCVKESERLLAKLNECLVPYKSEVEYYQGLGKLDDPVNFGSQQQLAIVMFDILRLPKIDGRKTEKAVLKQMDNDFAKTLLDYRQWVKLISGFTEPLPQKVAKDGKIHAEFNQMGKEDNNVRTGRFSSTNPNAQQIPSGYKLMRMMFKASDGCVLCGSDFSAQEPRLLAHMCDEKSLKETFAEGRDPYATVSSLVFHKDYWECMEHHQDGTDNPEGKKLRKKAKAIFLGLLYGMGAKLLSTMLGVSVDECKEILNEFYKMFPNIRDFTVQNEINAKELGYVEDYLGRRRHLPDAQKQELEIKVRTPVVTEADVLFDIPKEDCMINVLNKELTAMWNDKYEKAVSSGRFYAKQNFKEEAKQNNVDVMDNGGFISKTMTQCTNARIQGSAASLTKKAMIALANDEQMKKWGFRILIPVHDELLCECKKEYAEECSKRLVELMVNSALPECSVGMKCDPYTVKHWYADEVSSSVYDTYEKLLSKGSTKEEAFEKICSDYEEVKREVLKEMCDGTFDPATEDV